MSISAQNQSEISNLSREINRGTRVISLSGLTSISAKAFILSQLQLETNKTFVIITDSNRELETWENDLDFFNSKFQIPNSKLKDASQSGIWNLESGITTVPSFEIDVYSAISPHAETLERRALALWELSAQLPNFVVTSAKSLIARTFSPKELQNLGAILKRDEDFAPEKLVEKLTGCGYVREEPLKNIGEFSVRGGIIDVWSPDAENPVRIEFFGDTIDSIREFDAETQLSIGQLKEISLAPMREFSATTNDFKDWAFFAKERFADEKFARNLKDRTQFAEEGETFGGWEFLINLLFPKTSSLFDFLQNCVLVIDEPTTIELHLSEFYENLSRRYAEISEVDEIGLEPKELFLTAAELRENIAKFTRIELRALGKISSETDEDFAV